MIPTCCPIKTATHPHITVLWASAHQQCMQTPAPYFCLLCSSVHVQAFQLGLLQCSLNNTGSPPNTNYFYWCELRGFSYPPMKKQLNKWYQTAYWKEDGRLKRKIGKEPWCDESMSLCTSIHSIGTNHIKWNGAFIQKTSGAHSYTTIKHFLLFILYIHTPCMLIPRLG